MKTFKTFFAVAVCSLLIAACAKKDNDFANKYKNAMGATVKNADIKTNADAAGILFDLIKLNTSDETKAGYPLSYQNPYYFKGTLMLNNSAMDFKVTLTGANQVVSYSSNFSSNPMTLAALCQTDACNPLYIMATIYRGNAVYAQVGYKFYRLEATADKDVYQLFDSRTALSSMDAMINFLNQ